MSTSTEIVRTIPSNFGTDAEEIRFHRAILERYADAVLGDEAMGSKSACIVLNGLTCLHGALNMWGIIARAAGESGVNEEEREAAESLVLEAVCRHLAIRGIDGEPDDGWRMTSTDGTVRLAVGADEPGWRMVTLTTDAAAASPGVGMYPNAPGMIRGEEVIVGNEGVTVHVVANDRIVVVADGRPPLEHHPWTDDGRLSVYELVNRPSCKFAVMTLPDDERVVGIWDSASRPITAYALDAEGAGWGYFLNIDAPEMSEWAHMAETLPAVA